RVVGLLQAPVDAQRRATTLPSWKHGSSLVEGPLAVAAFVLPLRSSGGGHVTDLAASCLGKDSVAVPRDVNRRVRCLEPVDRAYRIPASTELDGRRQVCRN